MLDDLEKCEGFYSKVLCRGFLGRWPRKKTSPGESLAGNYAYNPIRDSCRDFSCQRVLPRVPPRVSDRIICMTLCESLFETGFFYAGDYEPDIESLENHMVVSKWWMIFQKM